MSDSEDDFMSDKFLQNLPAQPASTSQTYSAKRHASSLQSLRKSQANNKPTLKHLEEERRREGLGRSLFDTPENGEGSTSAGGGKAMEMMKKMGWAPGQGLGKVRELSPPKSRKRFKPGDKDLDPPDRDDDDEEDEPRRGGIGTTSKPTTSASAQPRTEPIRISMWIRRKGLTARSPSPPPLPPSSSGNRNPDQLDAAKMARLGKVTDDFRERQRREFAEREVGRKEEKGRELLVGFDRDKGVKFHPLHILPSNPLTTTPRPLLKLIYPAQVFSPSPSRSRSPSPSPTHLSPSSNPLVSSLPGHGSGIGGINEVFTFTRPNNISAAEKLREQMRRDMLSTLALGSGEGVGEEDDDDSGGYGYGLGVKRKAEDEGRTGHSLGEEGEGGEEVDYEGVNWSDHISGAKKVLSMDPSAHLAFLVDQLRHEHLYCFWCAYKYGSWGEMEGVGGCPGLEEDDH